MPHQWIDWTKVKEYSKMPPTQRLTILYSLIILTLAGMNFKQWNDGKDCQQSQVHAEKEKAEIQRKCDSSKFALAQYYEAEKQKFFLDRIKKSDDREYKMDSTLSVLEETRLIQQKTLRRYGH